MTPLPLWHQPPTQSLLFSHIFTPPRNQSSLFNLFTSLQLTSPHLISSNLISSNLISSHLTLSHLISPHLISPHLISSLYMISFSPLPSPSFLFPSPSPNPTHFILLYSLLSTISLRWALEDSPTHRISAGQAHCLWPHTVATTTQVSIAYFLFLSSHIFLNIIFLLRHYNYYFFVIWWSSTVEEITIHIDMIILVITHINKKVYQLQKFEFTLKTFNS